MKKLNIKFNKKILFFSLALLLALTGLITTTVAWLTATGTKENTFVMGEVKYAFTSDAAANKKVVVPGENIFEGVVIKLTNTSTVETQVRFKIDVQDTTNSKPVQLPSIFIIGALDEWKTPSETDGYYYYCPASQQQPDPKLGKVEIGTTTGTLTIPLDMKFDGAQVGNTYANNNYTITITFQAKQLLGVDWADMGSINFETGLAN